MLNRPHSSAQISLHKSALFLLHSSSASLTPSKPFKSLPRGRAFRRAPPRCRPVALPLPQVGRSVGLFHCFFFSINFGSAFCGRQVVNFTILDSIWGAQNRPTTAPRWLPKHVEFGPGVCLIFWWILVGSELEKSLKSVVLSSNFEVFAFTSPRWFRTEKVTVLDFILES